MPTNSSTSPWPELRRADRYCSKRRLVRCALRGGSEVAYRVRASRHGVIDDGMSPDLLARLVWRHLPQGSEKILDKAAVLGPNRQRKLDLGHDGRTRRRYPGSQWSTPGPRSTERDSEPRHPFGLAASARRIGRPGAHRGHRPPGLPRAAKRSDRCEAQGWSTPGAPGTPRHSPSHSAPAASSFSSVCSSASMVVSAACLSPSR